MENPSKLPAILILCFCSCVGAIPAFCASEELVVVDDGRVRLLASDNQTVKLEYTIANVGLVDAAVSSVHASCGCVKVSIEGNAIKPGESRSLIVHLNPQLKNVFSDSVAIQYQTKGKHILKVPIRAAKKGYFEVSDRVVFLDLSVNKQPHVVKISSPIGSKVAFNDVVNPDGLIVTKSERSSNAEEMYLEFVAGANCPTTAFTAEILLQVDDLPRRAFIQCLPVDSL